MIKSIVVIVVSALLVGVTLAEEVNETEKCAEEIDYIIPRADYPDEFEGLVEVTREFYANFEHLLQAFGNWSTEYREAMRKAPTNGFIDCDQIFSLAEEAPKRECDMVKLLERGSDALMDIARGKAETEKYFEAYYICLVRQESVIEKCVEESADFISKNPVTEDVEKLVGVSRQIYSKIEDLVESLRQFPTSKFKEAMENATLEDFSYCKAVLENAENLFEGCFANLFEDSKLVSRILRLGRSETEKFFEAVSACGGARLALEEKKAVDTPVEGASSMAS